MDLRLYLQKSKDEYKASTSLETIKVLDDESDMLEEAVGILVEESQGSSQRGGSNPPLFCGKTPLMWSENHKYRLNSKPPPLKKISGYNPDIGECSKEVGVKVDQEENVLEVKEKDSELDLGKGSVANYIAPNTWCCTTKTGD